MALCFCRQRIRRMAYKKGDYAKYHKSKRMKVERAARNKNRKKAERKGKVRKGDGRHIDHKDGNPKIQGLWWNGKITPGSAIYKLLRFYGVGKLRELVGKTANVEPDKNDFLILTTCKVDHSKNGQPTKANLFD